MLGSLPKKYLHDALAGHSDETRNLRGEGAVVATPVYQCGFDHQVAESPFVESGCLRAPLPVRSFVSPVFTFHYTDAVRDYYGGIWGRGPPAPAFHRC